MVTRKRSQLIPYQILFASRDVPFFAAEDLNVFLTDAFHALRDLLIIKQNYREGRTPSFIYWNDAIMEVCDRVRKYRLNKAERESLRNHMSQRPFASMEEAVGHLHKFHSLGKVFPNGNICEIILGFSRQRRYQRC